VGIQFEGQLNFISLPEVLQCLAMNRKTGVLKVVGVDGDRFLYFQEGKIIFVSSLKPGQRFGEYLARTGHLEIETVEASLRESRAFGVPFTQYLIEEQMLDPGVLRDVLASLAEEILCEVTPMRKGSFVFSVPLPGAVADGPIAIEAEPLVLNSVRRLDEEAR